MHNAHTCSHVLCPQPPALRSLACSHISAQARHRAMPSRLSTSPAPSRALTLVRALTPRHAVPTSAGRIDAPTSRSTSRFSITRPADSFKWCLCGGLSCSSPSGKECWFSWQVLMAADILLYQVAASPHLQTVHCSPRECHVGSVRTPSLRSHHTTSTDGQSAESTR